jgi:hypothetical protein
MVGLGPAGAGFLFNAFRSGACGRLAERGLLVLDAGRTVGAGRLGEYRVSANSVNDVFLNCLADPAFGELFAPLRALPAFRRMQADPQGVSMLPEVAPLLGAATELLVAELERRHGPLLRRQTRVEAVRVRGDRFELRARGPDGRPYVLHAGTLLLNTGGMQTPSLLAAALAGLGLAPPREPGRVLSSDYVLSRSPAALRGRFGEALRRRRSVAVLGGSHSAFSVLERLALELEACGLEELVLLHRSPVKLFFETRDEARQAGYRFDETLDVCPVSGRVNRSGGLRYRAFAVGQAVLAGEPVPGTGVRVRLLQVDGRDAAAVAEARQRIDAAAALVQCVGYQPRLPPLLDEDGRRIRLREVQGGVDADAAGSPCDRHGRRLERLHMFGLGSGLAVDPAIGSEPSFQGRIYGVWQFHHEASRPALERVLARADAA